MKTLKQNIEKVSSSPSIPFAILTISLSLVSYFFTASPLWAAPTLTPEKEAAFLGRRLKPISNKVWKEIAGPKISDNYSVVKGDTLYDISHRLFGDPKYWPKIWALNNAVVTNPHWLKPGFEIVFSPGSGESLPSVTVGDLSGKNGDPDLAQSSDENSASRSASRKSNRSKEWRMLPSQKWEHFEIPVPPNVDPLGFDKDSKVIKTRSNGFDVMAFAASEEIPILGQIVGSRSEANYLSLNDLVYIEAEERLQIGETYGVTGDPTLLKSKKSDRMGYSYLNLGKVKILAIRDHVYAGRILGASGFIPRGSYLVPLPGRIPELKPIPGPRPIPGVLILDRSFSTYTTAQHKIVFIDRGSDDGVEPGMVFRSYQHQDPSNKKTFSKSNFIIDADFIVIQVTPTMCTALVLNSISPVFENAPVVLLTDISDLLHNDGYSLNGADDSDDLDDLDDGKGLRRSERRTLKQLERWKGNPETPPPPTNDAQLDSAGNLPSVEPGSMADGVKASAPTADLPGPMDSADGPLGKSNSTADDPFDFTSDEKPSTPSPTDANSDGIEDPEIFIPDDSNPSTSEVSSEALSSDNAGEPPLSPSVPEPSSGSLDSSSVLPPESMGSDMSISPDDFQRN